MKLRLASLRNLQGRKKSLSLKSSGSESSRLLQNAFWLRGGHSLRVAADSHSKLVSFNGTLTFAPRDKMLFGRFPTDLGVVVLSVGLTSSV